MIYLYYVILYSLTIFTHYVGNMLYIPIMSIHFNELSSSTTAGTNIELYIHIENMYADSLR